MFRLQRFIQVIKYASIHSKKLGENTENGRWCVFNEMLSCYFKYRMWTNQYIKEEFHLLSKEEKKTRGLELLEKNHVRDDWYKDFVENRRFLCEYTQRKYELPSLREKRNKAYQKRYNMGKNCFVEHGVELSRQHYLNGSVSIGDNVTLAKNVFIDYSGQVIIKNGVKMGADVIIETHHRDLIENEKGNDVNIPTDLLIEENAYIGVRALILDSCNYIGKNARIGAGAVVTKDVPDNVTVVGVPAKIIRYHNDQN